MFWSNLQCLRKYYDGLNELSKYLLLQRGVGKSFQLSSLKKYILYKSLTIRMMLTNFKQCSIFQLSATRRFLTPFMYVVKWPNILQKFYGVNIARLLKYVWPFYNIMYERINFFSGHRNGALV